MEKRTLNDMLAFLSVAREQSFTKAAGKLGITTSALSHSMRALEERLGVRLLTRTTRRVSTTEAGERLMNSLSPLFEEVEYQIDALSALKEKPSGSIRLTCTDHAAEYVLHDKIAEVVRQYPDINVEVILDYGLTDIVGERIDAGIRQGELISQEMIAMRISPDWRFSLVGTPEYFARNPAPKTPYDLTRHNCAKLRLSSRGGIWAWEFQKGKKEFSVKINGQLTYNSIMPGFNAALKGLCLAYVPLDVSQAYIESGQLVEVLVDWSLKCQGFHIYYPNRRQPSPAFSALLEIFRHKAKENAS